MAQSKPQFYNYPEPKEAPPRPYSNPPKSNPIVKGLALSVGASAISSLGFVQNFLWSNAGFSALRDLKDLEAYPPRYDPTVIPIRDASKETPNTTSQVVPQPEKAKGSEPRFYSAADYHNLYKSGKLTPTAVAKALLRLIQRKSSPPGAHSIAWLEAREDLILKAAEASTARYKAGQSLGGLDGVPVGVKDEVELDGYKKCLGTLQDHTRKEGGTSWCVAKWEEEGALIMGKLTMHELGLDTTNNNPNYGTPLNPYNKHYYTGGSSGGSGYAVGTGLLPIALGADGGGSIRIPATYCGVFGLKTSHGRVSGLPTVSIAPSTGVLGPLAATMADLEISYRSMARPDPSDGISAVFPPRSTTSNANPKVLGIYKDWLARADPPVAALCQKAIDYFTTKLGYKAIDITIPYIPEAQGAHAMTILSEISTGVKCDVRGLTPANKILISVGAKTPATDFLLAQQMRSLLMQHMAYLYQKHPGMILLSPTTPNAGWHIKGGEADLKGISDGNMSFRAMEYVWFANMVGLPSLSVPMGYVDPVEGDDKIPVGLMATAEWGEEDALIEWGKEAERYLNDELEGGRVMPPTWVDVIKLASEESE